MFTKKLGLIAVMSIVVMFLGVVIWYNPKETDVGNYATLPPIQSGAMNIETPTPTRISEIIVYPESTADPLTTPGIPPGPTPQSWMFSENQAVEYTKSRTGTDHWTNQVVLRTTIVQVQYLFGHWNQGTFSPPPIDQDNSVAVWVVAFETDTMLTTGQVTHLTMQMPDSNASEQRGKKAVVVFDEIGNPYSAHFLEEVYPNGQVIQSGPTFGQIANLPTIPGTIPSPTPVP